MKIKVMKSVLEAEEDKAQQVRQLLRDKNVLMINLIGSPGCGKTMLLERTLEQFRGKYRMAVIEGDVATDRDAQRLKKFGQPIVLINTEGGCHLDSPSIEKALQELDLDELDIVFVENVGNLVCPAEFDLGEEAKIAVSSVPEGDDKPLKYPFLFREAKAVVLNKIDLLKHTNFNKINFLKDIQQLNGVIPVFNVSCTAEQGLESWYQWLSDLLEDKKRRK